MDKFVEKTKNEPKKMFRVTNEGNFTSELSNNEERSSNEGSKIKSKIGTQKFKSSSKSKRNPPFKENFNKIAVVINNLKEGVDNCKRIRQSTINQSSNGSRKFHNFQSSYQSS